MKTFLRSLMATALVVGAMAAPKAASAQSNLDASQAQGFIGAWVIDMDTDMGPISMDLEIKDMSGKVGATVGGPPEMGPPMDVTDITLDGEALVLTWEMDAQGQIFPIALSLERDGENLTALFDVADGQFMADGTGTPAGS